jgi:diaminopimelate epimerase
VVTVDMGAPKFGWRDIPLASAVNCGSFPLRVDGQEFTAAAVSFGNPHCVIFVNDAAQVPVADVGPRIERHPFFPSRTNVEFVSVLAPGRLRLRVWERGAGITRACGTGACAAVVTASSRGLGPRASEVVVDGGTLNVDWRPSDDHVLMTGPASLAFTGSIDLTRLDSRE